MNSFEDDALLKAWLKRRPEIGPDARARLSAFGELCGTTLPPLIEEAHRDENLPRLERFDRWGKRIEEVRYHPAQRQARRLALEGGVLPPVSLIERMTKAYLLNQNGEGGVACPLAMTDGLVSLLEAKGTPEQKRRYLPLLRDPDSATPLTGGQFVTERQGGSNVSENETRAELQGDGTWRLTGLKWFCSNPGELWVTTAKPKGSDAVALFLMPRVKPDGALNDCHILRLKDLCGTRGKATAEVEFQGAYAELIGRPSHGLAILLGTVLKTSRVHVGAGSLGILRRALVEAKRYAQERVVLGRPVAKFPAAARALERLEARWAACFLAYFESLSLLEAGSPAADILVPLLKIHISREATQGVREAQLIFAGNGILRDFSVLPRLSQDAIIQEIWEGTHAILAGHAIKALRRPAGRKAFEALIGGPCPSGADDEAVCEAAFQSLTRALLQREAGLLASR